MQYYNFLVLFSLLFIFGCNNDTTSSDENQRGNKSTTQKQKKEANNPKLSKQKSKKSHFVLNNMTGEYNWLCCNKKNNGVIEIIRKINSNEYSGTMYNSKYANKVSKVTLKVTNSEIVIDRDKGKQVMTIPINSNKGLIKIGTYESEFELTKK